MSKLSKIVAICFVVAMLLAPTMVFAQDGAPVDGQEIVAAKPINLATIGAGIVIIGGAYGIGRIGSAALESMARQPEVASQISSSMIVAAALVEGATLFAVVVCMIGLFF
ncbi:MAG: ATP synthase F0 subunit C [Planctomycetia bacterium]|nr:ATP synthase F0 subunit C [Planctomycetia bacterium]